MKLQLIRNATLRIEYAGRHILTDPDLAPKHTRRTLASVSTNLTNPMVDLPCSPAEVVAGVELVLVSHLHKDHFDHFAAKPTGLAAPDLPILCQPGDEGKIREQGFHKVTPVADSLHWNGIAITRTPGQHGVGDADHVLNILNILGNVSGFVLQAEGEPVVYWCGDTVWYEAVRATIERFQPAIIITHSSGSIYHSINPIVMDADHTVAVCQAAPTATVVAIHMEALDHGQVTRAGLRSHAEKAGISAQQLLIPADGERLEWD